MPTFFDNSNMELRRVLEDNYLDIKEEVLDFYFRKSDKFLPQYVPYKYQNDKWIVFTFYGFMLRYQTHLDMFPRLSKVLTQIPDLVTAQIVVLEPHTRVTAHFAGSNALIRSHLGIKIPGKYPELGFRMKQEERCWEEGKVLSFCESHRHYVWNYTDEPRIILLIDTVHPDYKDKKKYASCGVLSMLALKMVVHKFPFTRRMPDWLTVFFHKLFIGVFWIVLSIQDRWKVNIAEKLQKAKLDKDLSSG